ncbi:MAG: segregation/condensation protein A [Desulfatiglandales bacterium]|nr:segregation/condensation protein A [Desulfatiglandales bacterium]
MLETKDYEIKLEIFQGPLDLLLHLIRKNEVDIFDIPIAIITDQYLEYLDMMKALNINVVGDFLVMASTLIHIKSKMLLPEVEEEEEEDPRVEITRPLLEFLRLKEVAGELAGRDLLDRDIFSRPLFPDYKDQLQAEGPLLDVTIFQLMDAFKRVIDERLPGASLKLQIEEWSLKDKTTSIMERLKMDGSIYFRDLFFENRTLSEFIITFLALLELVHIGLVRVFQPFPDKDIKLEALFSENEEKDHD